MRVLFFLNQYNAFNYDTWPYFQKSFYYTKLYNTFSVWFNRFIQLWFWELSRFCCKSMIRSNNVPRKERRSLSGIACKLGLPCVWMVKSVFSIVHPLCEDWRIEKSAIRLLTIRAFRYSTAYYFTIRKSGCQQFYVKNTNKCSKNFRKTYGTRTRAGEKGDPPSGSAADARTRSAFP